MFKQEKSAILSLAAIMAFRMFGLFIILPVFSVHARDFSDATASLIGVALGVYGLTQALLQMPFGILSDRFGRKPMIALGLVLFALGSMIAASSHSIYGLIIGRAVQGAGAIGSTTLALLADLTRDENRSKAMALMGLTIGSSFMLAMMIGPVVSAYLQLSGVFWITALLALVGLLLLFTAVPRAPRLIFDRTVATDARELTRVLHHPLLRRLNIGIGSLHALMTALFLGVPLLLAEGQVSEHSQMLLYVSVLIGAFAVVMPLIAIAEKKRLIKPIFITAISALALACFMLLIVPSSTLALAGVLLVFFTGFTFLEATLPSMISKIAPLSCKGTAMGVYSTSQFFGIFVGGACGGFCLQFFGIDGLFVFCTLIASAWLCYSMSMPPPPYLSTVTLVVPSDITQATALLQQLRYLPGVADSALLQGEPLIYLKIDKAVTNETQLREWLLQKQTSEDAVCANNKMAVTTNTSTAQGASGEVIFGEKFIERA